METILPPEMAVRMVWSLTDKFHNKDIPEVSSQMTETLLTDIKTRAVGKDKEYVDRVIATMYAALRNLGMIYRGRELNFTENERLRLTYLEAVQKNIEFGKNAWDYLKTIPAMTVGGAGSVTVAEIIFKTFDIKFLVIVGLFFAAVGFMVHLIYIRLTRNLKLKLYVRQDYERTLYYEQYLNRVLDVLNSLNKELNQIHQDVYGNQQPPTSDNIKKYNIKDFLSGVHSTFCENTHKYMSQKTIKPDNWARCEAGFEKATDECPAKKSRIERLKQYFLPLCSQKKEKKDS